MHVAVMLTCVTLLLVCRLQFQRSYRACVRAHKLALSMQRQFW
jgi:hypothetical protein